MKDQSSDFEQYEILGWMAIEKVLREKRNLPITFRAAYHVWAEFSDKYYSAGWMNMTCWHGSALEEVILKAYDEFFPSFIHRCDKDDPWTEEKSKRAYHVDAEDCSDGEGKYFHCPNCHLEWEQQPK